jgi:hypothetical protein
MANGTTRFFQLKKLNCKVYLLTVTYVLSKGKLSGFCAENFIPGQPFKDFYDATSIIQSGMRGAFHTAIPNRFAKNM